MFFDYRYIFEMFPQILKAFPITFFIVIISTIFGWLFGLVLAVVRLEKIAFLSPLVILYTSFIQGTPVIVQLFLVYYGLPFLLGQIGVDTSGVSKLTFMYIAYSLNTAAYTGEIIRSSIDNVPKHQFDAAYSVGLTKLQAYRYYIIPQALKEMIPNIEISVVSLLQNSSLATYLGIYDIMGKAQLVGANTSHQIEANIVAAIIFIVLSVLIHLGFKTFFYQEEQVRDTVSTAERKESQSESIETTLLHQGELSYE